MIKTGHGNSRIVGKISYISPKLFFFTRVTYASTILNCRYGMQTFFLIHTTCVLTWTITRRVTECIGHLLLSRHRRARLVECNKAYDQF